jgi:hypothetical protein
LGEINAKLAFWQKAQRQNGLIHMHHHRDSGSTATVCLWQ